MNSAFSWLNNLIQWFGRWVPRIVLVRSTHAGVLFGPRGAMLLLKPGLTWYWPMTSELRMVPTTVRSWQVASQGLLLREDNAGVVPKSVFCSAAVQARVTDPIKSVDIYDLRAFVSNRVQAAMSIAWLENGSTDDRTLTWFREVTTTLQHSLLEYGIELVDITPTDLTVGAVLKQVNDWHYQENLLEMDVNS